MDMHSEEATPRRRRAATQQEVADATPETPAAPAVPTDVSSEPTAKSLAKELKTANKNLAAILGELELTKKQRDDAIAWGQNVQARLTQERQLFNATMSNIVAMLDNVKNTATILQVKGDM
jgi:pyruvate/2-oxoglutarate dehydrogenase complex dihydrolipoamide acyltransferase (E2) component